MSKTHKVATFGGFNSPYTRMIMEGFRAGALAWGENTGSHTELLGWDGQRGTFVGTQTDRRRVRSATRGFISRGADVIFPVVGGAGSGAARVAFLAGNVFLIGLDADQFHASPRFSDVWLTSVTKRIERDTLAAVTAESDGDFDGGLRVGTLANGGVGLAPYHAASREVPAHLRTQLQELHRRDRGGVGVGRRHRLRARGPRARRPSAPRGTSNPIVRCYATFRPFSRSRTRTYEEIAWLHCTGDPNPDLAPVSPIPARSSLAES